MNSSMPSRAIRALTVLWPSFLATILLEGLVFSAFDPQSLRWTDSMGDPLSPLAVYTLGFLAIWAMVSLAAAMARSFDAPPAAA